MKGRKLKYLIALSPAILCTILAFSYTRLTPRDVTDLHNPYRTQPMLKYLSTAWFYIGIVLSLVFLCIVIIEDVFGKIEAYLERRNIQKHEQRRNPT